MIVSGPLTELSNESVVRAIEDNVGEFLVALGRVAGSEERRDASVHWTIGGTPIDYHNAVIRADLASDEVDRVIRESIDDFRSHGVPGTWHVGPSIDLDALDADEDVPEDLTITSVTDGRSLDVWIDTLGQGFGEGPREAEWVGSMYERLGLDENGAWHHFLAHRDGVPVGTTTLFLGAGVAGVYFVFTTPAHRRLGIGGALTMAALRRARDLGYLVGVLGSSRAGLSVYRRLGFREYCAIEIYEWSPMA